MEQDEWGRRFKERLVEHGMSPMTVQIVIDSVDYEDLVIGYEEDPEGAADEELRWYHDIAKGDLFNDDDIE